MIALKTTDKELNHLQNAVNESREGSIGIKVNKTALRNLLLDHYALNAALTKRGTVPEIVS